MAAVVEVRRFGELAGETVFVSLTVARWPEVARGLIVDSPVELAGVGASDRTHVLEGKLAFECPGEAEATDGTAETSDSSE